MRASLLLQVLGVMVLAAGLGLSTAQATSFQDGLDGYAGTDDISPLQDAPSYPYGTAAAITIGYNGGQSRSAALRFDLSALAGQTVQSAYLTLTKNANSSADSTFTGTAGVYAMHPANAGWVEAESTWNSAASGLNWKDSAGADLPDALGFGGSYDSTSPLATFPIMGDAEAPGTVHTVVIPAALVQNWIDNPAQNAGFALAAATGLSGSSCWYAASSENTNPAWRPMLIINEPVPEPGTLALLSTGLIGLLCYAWRKRR
jgi:hypothetical protein